MAFETFSDFLQMGRHGLYVWSAYGLTALTLISVIFVSKWRFKQWKHQAQRQQARENRHQAQQKARQKDKT